jgi:Animal haem peroxidase
MNRVAAALAALLVLFIGGGSAQAGDPRLDLFLQTIRPPGRGTMQPNPVVSQAKLEQLLRILPPVTIGHGGGAALSQSAPGGVPPADPSIYGFCYEACRTERAVASCGTPAPGAHSPPQHFCRPIQDSSTLRAIIGLPLGTGASPFVDDNTGPDSIIPAGYTFLGQFVDHDLTRTTAALSALGALVQQVGQNASLQAALNGAGITPGQLRAALSDAASPNSALSANTGKLDLDSVYGVTDFATLSGISAPWFEQQSDGSYTGRFAMREVQAPTSAAYSTVIDGFDYIRSADGTPQVPDPRNSEHKMISQLQNLFELAHNDCVDHALDGITAPTQQQIATAFDGCHKKVIWTYETIVATDLLPRLSDEAALDRVAPGALHALDRGGAPTSTLPDPSRIHTALYACTPGLGTAATIRIPHEFAVAAFRLGHSLVRDDYVLHDRVYDANGNLLTGGPRPLFAPAGQPASVGLLGDNPLQPADVIDWSYFFDFGGQKTAQATRPLDTLISDTLFSLPLDALPPGPDANGKDTSSERNLPRRNLLRAAEQTSVLTGAVGLATGEEVEHYAQARIPGLHDATTAVKNLIAQRLKSAGFQPDAMARTPLWLFVLAEAEATENGNRLGELGSEIVDEFLLGSLRCDMNSVLYAKPADAAGWAPSGAAVSDRHYSMPDLITYLRKYAKHPVPLSSR